MKRSWHLLLLLLLSAGSLAAAESSLQSKVVYASAADDKEAGDYGQTATGSSESTVASPGSSLDDPDLEDAFGRAAVHGHYSQAANPHRQHPVYPTPPLPPFLHHPAAPGAPPSLSYHHDTKPYGYQDDDLLYHQEDDRTNYEDQPVYEDEKSHYVDQEDYSDSHSGDKTGYGGGGADYDDLIDYVKPAIGKGIRQLEKLLETLYLVKDLVHDAPKKTKCPKPDYGHESCDPAKWSKCNCLSPATFTDEGRGNCNLGATKMDLKVWCYVENKYGNPEEVCPDSKPSKSKPGYFWSRFACIT